MRYIKNKEKGEVDRTGSALLLRPWEHGTSRHSPQWRCLRGTTCHAHRRPDLFPADDRRMEYRWRPFCNRYQQDSAPRPGPDRRMLFVVPQSMCQSYAGKDDAGKPYGG